MSGEYDVIFHWGELTKWLGSGWEGMFTNSTRDVVLPKGSSRNYKAYQDAIFKALGERPIHRALTNRGWAREGIRIGVLGFSETCIGASVLLASADGGVIDFIYANDGIHARTELWSTFGKQAAYGLVTNPNCPPTEKCLVITHSQTPAPPTPAGQPTIPSTSETAEIIAKSVMESPVPTKFVPIPELKDAPHEPVTIKCSYDGKTVVETIVYNKVPGYYSTNVGNFYVFGYENQGKTCTDHIYQSKVIGPRVMKHIIIPRWNNNPRGTGSCVVA